MDTMKSVKADNWERYTAAPVAPVEPSGPALLLSGRPHHFEHEYILHQEEKDVACDSRRQGSGDPSETDSAQ